MFVDLEILLLLRSVSVLLKLLMQKLVLGFAKTYQNSTEQSRTFGENPVLYASNSVKPRNV